MPYANNLERRHRRVSVCRVFWGLAVKEFKSSLHPVKQQTELEKRARSDDRSLFQCAFHLTISFNSTACVFVALILSYTSP